MKKEDESNKRSCTVAVLLTCHNRKSYTLRCLTSIFGQTLSVGVSLTVFLVDDGSVDGTSETVAQTFPNVRIITGDGSLFWAGGMRLSWKTALESGNFDYFWLVNDDTFIYEDALSELLKADNYTFKNFGKNGIYSGSTLDPNTKEHSYGGHRLLRPNESVSSPVIPNGEYQSCEFCNANILLIPLSVVETLGIFSERYVHSIADFDYSMRAVRANLPVLVLPDFAGECVDDNILKNASKGNLKKRIYNLYSPKGYAYKDFLFFTRTFFPSTTLKTAVSLWIRTLFPRWWNFYKRKKE
jgi:GT2 family glycosyltransferase